MNILKSSDVPNWIWVVIFSISITAMFYLGLNPEHITKWWAFLLTYNLVMIFFSFILIYKNLKNIKNKEKSGELGSKLTLSFIKIVPLLAIAPVLSFYIFSFNTLQNTIHSVEIFADDLQKERIEKLAGLRSNLVNLKLSEYHSDSRYLLQSIVNNNSYDINSKDYISTMMAIAQYFISSTTACRIIIKDDKNKVLADTKNSGICTDNIKPITNKNTNIYYLTASPSMRLLKDSVLYNDDRQKLNLSVVYAIDTRTNNFLDRLINAEDSRLKIELNLSSLRRAFLIDMSSTFLLVALCILLIIFKMINTLMSPLSRISQATKEVSQGNYDVFIPYTRNDDTKILVDLFNQMAKQVKGSQYDLATQKVYLETILKYSYGVIALDENYKIKIINDKIGEILKIDNVADFYKKDYLSIADNYPILQILISTIANKFSANTSKWHTTIEITIDNSVILLSIQGARLDNDDDITLGYVIIIDDITKLRQAQNRIAWASVAMKMAHEVKNPLTPILLSAQRLRDKILPKLSDNDRQIVDKTTTIISQQVKSIDTMLSAFTQYAKAPAIEKHRQSLVKILMQVVELYKVQKNVIINTNIDDNIPNIALDANSIQRVLINLFKNSIEAIKNNNLIIDISLTMEANNTIDLVIIDNGYGFSSAVKHKIFKPYISTKGKGGGFGMAIVKNILTEHEASINIDNVVENNQIIGAMIKISFKIL